MLWKPGAGTALIAYLKLQAEYGDRVHFLPVRPDFGHDQNKSYDERLKEARTWADEVGLPGPLLVDDDSCSLPRFGKGVVPSWAKPKKAGDKPGGWGYMYVLDPDGAIVHQHGPAREFRYHQCRFVLDRLLDPEFDRAFGQGFPDRQRTLPTIQERAGGVAYIDDFESYADSYDLKLQPRWGFTPAMENLVWKFGVLQDNEGRNGSRATAITGAAPGRMHNTEHVFPRPLSRGHVQLYVRRGPSGWNKSDPKRVVAVTLYGGDKRRAGTIEAKGVWEREPFALDGETGEAILSRDDWHCIEVNIRHGAGAAVAVDGETLGTLPTRKLTRIGLNCGHHGFFLDDVELFYAGRPRE
ncbi:MAG: hypothetical protein PVH68_01700 [Armatimonadota bacterium]